MAGQGPPPKPADKRRRRNTPATWGDAQPTEVPAAGRQNRVLSIDNPHHLVVGLWEAVQESAEAAFYSEADWARLAMELWHADTVLTNPKGINANSWAAVQHGLTELLISPAAKRRCAIVLKPPVDDPDEHAAVLQIARYQAVLKPE